MKRKVLLGIIITIGFFTSCENSRRNQKNKKQGIDYSNKKILDSLIKITPHSTETLFLGFKIGMNKTEYKKQVHKLRKDGKILSYSNSNKISNMAGTFELGAGYTFKTTISAEKDGKTLTGNGKYFLEPIYNKGGKLMQLNILPVENWDGDYIYSKPDWLEPKVRENSERLKDQELKQALIENEFINKYDFIRQKNNLIIYETTLTINYVDLKTLMVQLLIKETEKEIIKKDNENIKF